jgi:hypothetical protein
MTFRALFPHDSSFSPLSRTRPQCFHPLSLSTSNPEARFLGDLPPPVQTMPMLCQLDGPITRLVSGQRSTHRSGRDTSLKRFGADQYPLDFRFHIIGDSRNHSISIQNSNGTKNQLFFLNLRRRSGVESKSIKKP